MLRVTHGNQIERLIAALLDDLPPVDPFARVPVVVPSHLMQRALQLAIAGQRGACVGLDFTYLDPFLLATYGKDEALGALPRERVRAVLLDLFAAPAGLDAPLRAYLGPTPTARRRLQLADRLTDLYWGYARSRADWMWHAQATGLAQDPSNPAAVWQASLWREVARACPGSVAPAPMLPLVRRQTARPVPSGGPIFVLGFASLAPSYVDALTDLATARDVFIYQLDPCAELWDDVGRRDDAVPLGSEPELLARWGRPARDAAQVLVERTAGDLTSAFALVDGPAASVRDQLVRDMQTRQAPGPLATAPAVPDIQIWACPSPRRELEVIGQRIAALLDDDASLAADQIAVYVAGDARAYMGQVSTVFESIRRHPDEAGVPHHLVDSPLPEEGSVAEAALMLLDLPVAGFTRPAMLGVMTHPLVMARFPDARADEWARWTGELGIIHGADDADHAHTYLAGSDRFHWQQGLARIALGAFVAPLEEPSQATGGPSGTEEAAAPDGAVGYPPRWPLDVPSDRQASAAAYVLLARSLIADVRWLAGLRATYRRWAEILPRLLRTYLVVSPREASELDRLSATLARVAEFDASGREAGWDEVSLLAEDALGGSLGKRGQPLCDGVLVAPLAANRPLAFRHVFVVGLGDGRFPRARVPDSLDLRWPPRPGEVSRPDEDRASMLEALLCARDSLTLSYVGFEPVSGEALAPSACLLELASALVPYLGSPDAEAALATLTVQHPLHRWDAPAVPAGPGAPRLRQTPAMARERHAQAVRAALQVHATSLGTALPVGPEAVPVVAVIESVRAALPPPPPPTVVPGEADRPATASQTPARVVTLSQLTEYVLEPAKAWASVVLGLRQEDDDDDHIEDEPFTRTALDAAILTRQVFARTLRQLGQATSASVDTPTTLTGSGYLDDHPRLTAIIHEAYDHAARELALRSQAPVGALADGVRRRETQLIEHWISSLQLNGPVALTRAALGRTRRPDATLHPALELDVTLPSGVERIAIAGDLTDRLHDRGSERGPVTLVVNAVSDRHWVRLAVEHLCLAAMATEPAATTATVVEAHKLHHRTFAAVPQARAQEILTTWLVDLLGAPHPYQVSLDALRKYPTKGRAGVKDQRASYGAIDVRSLPLAPPAIWDRHTVLRAEPIASLESVDAGRGKGKRRS